MLNGGTSTVKVVTNIVDRITGTKNTIPVEITDITGDLSPVIALRNMTVYARQVAPAIITMRKVIAHGNNDMRRSEAQKGK